MYSLNHNLQFLSKAAYAVPYKVRVYQYIYIIFFSFVSSLFGRTHSTI